MAELIIQTTNKSLKLPLEYKTKRGHTKLKPQGLERYTIPEVARSLNNLTTSAGDLCLRFR